MPSSGLWQEVCCALTRNVPRLVKLGCRRLRMQGMTDLGCPCSSEKLQGTDQRHVKCECRQAQAGMRIIHKSIPACAGYRKRGKSEAQNPASSCSSQSSNRAEWWVDDCSQKEKLASQALVCKMAIDLESQLILYCGMSTYFNW